jgi:hypothetical protein
LPRSATAVVVVPLLALTAGVTASCGSTNLTTAKAVTRIISQGGSVRSASVAQGTSAEIEVKVTNVGGGSLRGVTIRMNVPSGFSYANTVGTAQSGDASRSSDVVPAARDSILTWGSWTIGPGGAGQPSQVTVTVDLTATGPPGTVELSPQVFATGYNNAVDASPAKLVITAAPSLSFVLRVSPTSATSGADLTYHAMITNTGSGSAPGTDLGITLPSDFDYASTLSTSGNASTSGVTDPIAGSVIPTWSGYDIPGESSGGPGVLNIDFQVDVLPDVGPGTYESSASVVASYGSSDENQAQLNFGGLAAVVITGPSQASPSL